MYQDFSPFCGWLLLHATEMALGVSPFIQSWSRELFHGLAITLLRTLVSKCAFEYLFSVWGYVRGAGLLAHMMILHFTFEASG